jgi:hypothetical protein
MYELTTVFVNDIFRTSDALSHAFVDETAPTVAVPPVFVKDAGGVFNPLSGAVYVAVPLLRDQPTPTVLHIEMVALFLNFDSAAR